MSVFVSESNLHFSPSPWVVCVSVTQSCPTLCDPINCSLLGFSVHGILQTRIPEWAAIPFSSNPGPGIELRSPALQTDSLPSEPLGKPFLMWGQGQFIYVRKDGDFNLKLYLILSKEKNHSGQESCKKNWNWLVVEWWLTGIGGWRKCGGKGQRMHPLSYKMNKFGRPKVLHGAHI